MRKMNQKKEAGMALQALSGCVLNPHQLLLCFCALLQVSLALSASKWPCLGFTTPVMVCSFLPALAVPVRSFLVGLSAGEGPKKERAGETEHVAGCWSHIPNSPSPTVSHCFLPLNSIVSLCHSCSLTIPITRLPP